VLLKLRKLANNSFIRGGFYFTTATIIVNFLNYLFNLLTAHFFGPVIYGEIIALIAYLSIFTSPLSILSTLIIQKVSSRGEESREFANSVEQLFWKKISYWRWIFLLILVIVPSLPKLTNLQPITAYFLIPIVFMAFFGTFYSALNQGMQLFFWFSLVSIIAVGMKLTGALLPFFKIGSLTLVLLFLFLSYLVIFLGNRYFFKKIENTNHPSSIINIEKRLIHIFKNSQFIITFFSVLAMILFNNLDVVFVKKQLSASVSGLYSSLSLCAKIIFFLVGPLISTAFIYFSGPAKPHKKKQVLFTSLFLILLISLGSFLIYTFFGEIFVRTLFGNKFLLILPYLGKAAVFGGFYTAIMLLNNYFLAQKSKIALIIAFALPVYLVLLFAFGRGLAQIMELNIIFSAAVTTIYFISFIIDFSSLS